MNIDEMVAGPQLDALVAQRVMGWKVHNRNTAWWVDAEDAEGLIKDRGIRGLTCGATRWSPSFNIAAAWEVVEKMRDKFKVCRLQHTVIDPPSEYAKDEWVCAFEPKPWGARSALSDRSVWGYAHTAPLAICRAALLAVETTP